MLAISGDERFSNTNTFWSFWLVSNEMDKYAAEKACQTERPHGNFYKSKSCEGWVKTWAQILEDLDL